MLSTYGIHTAHDVACAGHDLRRAIRAMADDEATVDKVGLGLAANLADVLADALDRHWHITRRALDEAER